jgi:hypothetical protein
MIVEPPHLNWAGGASQIVGLCGWLEMASHHITSLGRWRLRVTLAVVLSGLLSLVLLAHFVIRAKVSYYIPHVRTTQPRAR